MKKIIIALFCLVSTHLMAQLNKHISNDSLQLYIDSSGKIVLPEPIGHAFGYYATNEYDTIRVVQLVCDTTEGIAGIVVWKIGYEVRQRFTYYGDRFFSYGEYYSDQYNHKEYLNANKLPLPKTTIVWMAVAASK